MQTEGEYYDGSSSKRHTVRLVLNGNQLQIAGDGIAVSLLLNEVSISAPLGSLKRSIYLPDGGKCDFDDAVFSRLIEQHKKKRAFFRGVHLWENSFKLIFVALVLTITLVIAFIQYGVPVLAERAAYAIPPETEMTLGRETLQILDRALFEPSELGAERQVELGQMFTEVIAVLDATDRPYRLELRKSPKIGANAFALPGGTVIFTDELVRMAESDEEIAAVLAHEVGHVRHRHAMRQVIQDSAVGLIVASLTGDVFSATSLAAALPTMLVDAKFSRDMERQADDVAVEYLELQGATVEHFAKILTRMEQAFNSKYKSASEKTGVTNYFSTHPATRERIERLRR